LIPSNYNEILSKSDFQISGKSPVDSGGSTAPVAKEYAFRRSDVETGKIYLTAGTFF
jgi:hypothetical protein